MISSSRDGRSPTLRSWRRSHSTARSRTTSQVFDGRLVRFHFFSGIGEIVEDKLAEDPSVVKLCAQAFEAVWERAIPHDQYQPI